MTGRKRCRLTGRALFIKGKGEADVDSSPSTQNSVLFHEGLIENCRMGHLSDVWACTCCRIVFWILFLLLCFEDETPCRKQSTINIVVVSTLLGEGGIWRAFQVFKNVGNHHQISNTQWDQGEREGWKSMYRVFYEWCALGVYYFKQCTCSNSS